MSEVRHTPKGFKQKKMLREESVNKDRISSRGHYKTRRLIERALKYGK